MARKLTVTTPRGTFTRKTDRPYTFAAVTGDLTDAVWMQRAQDGVAYERKLAAQYRRDAEAVARGDRRDDDILVRKYGREGYAAKLREWADANEAHSAVVEGWLADGRPEESRSKVEVSWHGTRALAEKALAGRVAFGFTTVGIFAVEEAR